HRALRTAVHDERDGILAARLEIDGLDDVTLHGVVLRALEREELVVAHADFREAFRVDVRDRRGLAAGGRHGVEICRRLERALRVDDAVADRAEAFHLAGAGEPLDLAVGDVDREQRMIALVVGRGVEYFSIFGQLQSAGRTVPAGIDLARLARGEIERHHRVTVRLEAGALHRKIVERLALGAGHGRRVPRLVRGRQVARGGRTVGRHRIDVEICGPGFGRSGDAHGKVYRASVGRKRVFALVAERFRRHVAVDADAQEPRARQRRLARSIDVDVDDVELRALAVGPRIP